MSTATTTCHTVGVLSPKPFAGGAPPAGTAPQPCGGNGSITAAFAVILPTIQAALCRADRGAREERPGASSFHARPGMQIIETLAANISLLQDNFMDTFYARLQELGVNVSCKLTLRLDRSARLVLAGEHPDQDAINALLAEQDELADAFAEIAAQSAMLRDLRSLHTLAMYARAADSYVAMTAGAGDCLYQLSMKGEMNHFYFTR